MCLPVCRGGSSLRLRHGCTATPRQRDQPRGGRSIAGLLLLSFVFSNYGTPGPGSTPNIVRTAAAATTTAETPTVQASAFCQNVKPR